MRVVVLGGAGLIGRASVWDLTTHPDLTEIVIADLNLGGAYALGSQIGDPRLRVEHVDVTDHESLNKVLKGAHACLNAVQYYYNLDVMRACLAQGVPYVDLGGLFHMTRRQLELDDEFRSARILGVPGVGACPGVTNVQARMAADQLDTVSSIRIYDGSSPSEESLHWTYSIHTILDEMSMNPVTFRGGEFVELKPLAEEESFEFSAPIGAKKVHHSLHSEVATLPIVYRNKGISEVSFKIDFFGYSEPIAREIALLAELGFAGTDEVTVGDCRIRPRDLLIELLQRQPTSTTAAESFEEVVTVVNGTRDGSARQFRIGTMGASRWGLSGSTVLTGVPPAIVAYWLACRTLSGGGVVPPELALPPEPFFSELEKRGCHTTVNVVELPPPTA